MQMDKPLDQTNLNLPAILRARLPERSTKIVIQRKQRARKRNARMAKQIKVCMIDKIACWSGEMNGWLINVSKCSISRRLK